MSSLLIIENSVKKLEFMRVYEVKAEEAKKKSFS